MDSLCALNKVALHAFKIDFRKFFDWDFCAIWEECSGEALPVLIVSDVLNFSEIQFAQVLPRTPLMRS